MSFNIVGLISFLCLGFGFLFSKKFYAILVRLWAVRMCHRMGVYPSESWSSKERGLWALEFLWILSRHPKTAQAAKIAEIFTPPPELLPPNVSSLLGLQLDTEAKINLEELEEKIQAEKKNHD